jgi:tetratricopeptide (TPR) repeat protein/transcriptional regulator with XRE-family HTH domain
MSESPDSRLPEEPIGTLLRAHREALGLTLTAFARSIYYSKSHVSKVERGETVPDLDYVEACEKALGIPGDLSRGLTLPPGRRTRPFSRLRTLPAVPTGFLGRDRELQAIDAALRRESGVCVITGIGGSGKTALAVRAAHAAEAGFTDGCLFLELASADSANGYDSASDALDRALRLLGVDGDWIPARPEDRAARYRDRLRGRKVLVVIDNAASAAQVLPLLPSEPGCRVLVTSRARLAALDGATHLPLGALPGEAAVALFRAVSGRGPADPAEVERTRAVVSRCAGMPLAIRVAAARLRVNPAWTVDDLQIRLGPGASRLEELDDGERSVRAVLGTHLHGLDQEQRLVVALLGLLPRPEFAATHVAALGGITVARADRRLAELHHLHVVESLANRRFRMHDLLHEMAVGECRTVLSAPDRAAAFHRFVAMMLRTTARADELLEPHSYRPDYRLDPATPYAAVLTDAAGAWEWLETEWRTLAVLCRRAAAHGEHERCWMLAFALRGYFFRTKRFGPWIDTQQCAVEAARAGGDMWALGASLSNLGTALFDHGDLDGAAECFEEAAGPFRAAGNGHGLTDLLAHTGWLALYRGEYDAAVRDLRRAAARYAYRGRRRNAAISWRGLSLALTALRKYEPAREAAEKALDAFDGLGLELDAAMAVNCLAWARYRSGAPDLAELAYRDAKRRAQRCGSSYEAARAELGLGDVAVLAGDREAAVRWWAAAEQRHPHISRSMVPEAAERARWQGGDADQPSASASAVAGLGLDPRPPNV